MLRPPIFLILTFAGPPSLTRVRGRARAGFSSRGYEKQPEANMSRNQLGRRAESETSLVAEIDEILINDHLPYSNF